MEVYPGDAGVAIENTKSIKKDGFNLSEISMGLHSGTHVDAPLHYLPGGKSIDQIPLSTLTGKAIVCDLTDVKDAIGPKDLENFEIEPGDIVYFKTRNSLLAGKKFSRKYVHLNIEGAEYLIEKKAKAVGIDYLSIEKYDSIDAPVHKKLLGRGIPIIEGLILSRVAGGRYLTHCLQGAFL